MAKLKPLFYELRELQREFLLLRWDAICARGDQAHYARSIDTHIVSHATGHKSNAKNPHSERLNFDNLPSFVEASSPFMSSTFLFVDAATCGLLGRRRKFSNFGDGMISYDSANGQILPQKPLANQAYWYFTSFPPPILAVRVAYYGENLQGYRSAGSR